MLLLESRSGYISCWVMGWLIPEDELSDPARLANCAVFIRVCHRGYDARTGFGSRIVAPKVSLYRLAGFPAGDGEQRPTTMMRRLRLLITSIECKSMAYSILADLRCCLSSVNSERLIANMRRQSDGPHVYLSLRTDTTV